MPSVSVEKLLKSTDGTVIFARAVGNRENPSLVFVHGLALSGSVFDDLFKDKHLLDRFYLVSYDMRGHGRSGKPEVEEGYASIRYADDFASVVKAFSLRTPMLIGWSLGATIACDICAHLGADSISGVVYAAGLPYTGPIMNEVGTPLVLGFLPGLFSTDDVNLSARTKIAFIDSLFLNPAHVPTSLKWSWLGATTLQLPAVSRLVLSRTQDPEKLLQEGSKGLPLLMISGSSDTQVQGDVVVKLMKPHFTNVEVHTIHGGSHALFYDNQEEFVQTLIDFSSRVLDDKGRENC
ncbi:alpha/beta-hydrolase [Crassisporium funariophilum]|nr:alpha/beta-hydrolase [Crassisporium funariophilum]